MEGSETTRGKDEHEAARFAAIDHLGAVRPEVDRVLQELVDDVREAFGTDLCMVSLVLSEVQYFRAWSGELPGGLAEARQDLRERDMCQYVVGTEAPLVIEDFLATEEFRDHYACVKYGGRFYAGVPLITSDGYAIGSLCLVNNQPREISEEQMSLLGAFGRTVVGRLELLGALVREQDAREDEARRSRELQRTLNSSRDMIATVDAHGILESVNQACATILGYEPRELGGRSSYMDLVHPDDRDLSAELTTAIEGGEAEVRFENRCLRKDGRVAWIEWSATPLREKGVAYCVARDATERRRAEEELRRHGASVELLQAVAVAANEAESFEEAIRCALELIWAHTEWPVGHAYLLGDSFEEVVPTSIWHLDAHAMRGDREKSLEAGMDDYVSKPVKSEELDEILERWIPSETPEPEAPILNSDNGSAKEEEGAGSSLNYKVIESLRELRVEGEPDILTQLVELFLSDVTPRLANLREAVEGGDAQSVEQIAHALKGSCGNMGASRMAAACSELQKVGASGDLARALGLLERIEAEFERVRSMLEAETAGS